VTASDEPPALAYIEKTLADSYRKEIDQEENVWRSLPFFAATLALQLAALFQIIDKLPDPTTLIGWLSVAFLALAGVLTLMSLGYLAASIYPQRFDYIAREPALLNYARNLIRDEQLPENQTQEDPFSALVTLKTEITRQYAQATDHNRQINKRRERRRSIAGLAALGSVLMTVFLVGTTYAHYLINQVEKDPGHAAPSSIAIPAPSGDAGNDPAGQTGQPPSDRTTPDAGRH
jgi:hypothetical protein